MLICEYYINYKREIIISKKHLNRGILSSFFIYAQMLHILTSIWVL